MRALGTRKSRACSTQVDAEEEELRQLLLPKDPRDDKNIFLEVRAGTGGDEAAIFAGDLLPHVRALRGVQGPGASRC